MSWLRRTDRDDDTDRYSGDPRYSGMGQGERASNARSDGWRLSALDEMHAAEHEAGLVRGDHFTSWSETVAQLKREERYGEALELLLEIIEATEAEQAVARANAPRRAEHIGSREVIVRETPPGWTNQAAIIYRKLGNLESEIAIIDRWISNAGSTEHWFGATQPKLVERREKAQALLTKRAGQTRT